MFISFPLRLDNAFLRRCEEPEAILALVRVMATTPHGAWAGSSHFGIRDLFEQARNKPDAPKLAVHEINRALEDLGITHYKVQSITTEPHPNRDIDSYVVTLASTDAASDIVTLTV